ncbi:MAG: hypothetical protein ACO4B6_10330 [Ilumatobacteraceae bacterium]
MFMFNRHIQVKPGQSAEAVPELIDLIARANSITGRRATVYTVVLGSIGRMWVADMFSTHGELMAMNAQLIGDADFMAAQRSFAERLDGPAGDFMARVTHVAGTLREPPGAVAVTTWQVDPRQWAASIAWSHQMADAQHAASGITQTIFSLAEPIPFTIGLCANAGSLDDIDAARSAPPDASILQLLESAPVAPTAGSMEGIVAIRVA